MRKFLSILSILCIIFLASCNFKKEDKLHVSFSTWGSQSEISTLKTIINDFEKENPDIKIDLIHIPDNYFKKLHLLIASNLSPDVIFLNNLNAQLYIKAGKLEVLNNYIDSSKKISKSDFIENSLLPLSNGNNIYAIPRDISNLVVYYNKDLFDKYNIKYPKQNWTMDEFLQTAQQLTIDTDNNGATDIFGFGFEKNQLFWLPFLWSNNGGILENNKIVLNSNNSKEALQFYADLRNKYHVAPNNAQQSSLTTSQMFLQGKVAMHLCGRWCSLTYKKNAQCNWDIAQFPNGKDGSVVGLDTSGWAISSSCKNKQAAWKFVEYLSSDKAISCMTQDGLILPAKKTVAYSDVFLSTPPKNATAFLNAINNAKITPVCTKYAQLTDLINVSFEKLFNGNSTVNEVVDENLIFKLNKIVESEEQ